MKLILRFLCLTAVYSTVESRSRLYHSHYPVLNNDHTCFYEYETNSNSKDLLGTQPINSMNSIQ